MCTVTIHREPHHLMVTMNRDELKSRASELPPSVHEVEGGTPWLGPADGSRGGTWFAVNRMGVVGCMTNGPMPLDRIPEFQGPHVPSRGEILPALLPLGTLDRMLHYLESEFIPSGYPAFQLILAGAEGVHSFAWSLEGGKRLLNLDEPWIMVSSSLWHSEEVDRYRRAAFESWLKQDAPLVDGIPAFHLIYDLDSPELSPWMDRGISCTRSITQALVQSDTAPTLRYASLVDPAPAVPRIAAYGF